MHKTFLHRIRIVLKKTWVRISVLLIAALVVGVAFASGRGGSHAEQAVAVERGVITKSISITGKTKAKSSADLSFERSGQVSKIYVAVGDTVVKGQTLIALDQSSLLADLHDAEANLDVQLSKLQELKTGSAPTTIALKQATIAKEASALASAKKNVVEKIQDAYTKSDNAIHNDVDQFISGANSATPTLNFNPADNQLKSTIEANRVLVGKALTAWNTELQQLSTDSDLQTAAAHAEGYLTTIKKFLDLTSLAVNSLTSSSLSQTTIDAYKEAVASARTDVNTALQNVSAATEKLSGATSDLAIAEQELQIALTGGTTEQIATQAAYVKQAEAKVQSMHVQLAKSVLRAPIAGVITKQDAEVGEIAEQFKTIVSVMGNSGLEIEAQVPEIDIGSLTVGNSARITIDAFPGETFIGEVGFIDPAETLIDGVVNFEVKLFFATDDPRLKSGLTSNVDIETLRKPDVLLLPESAVTDSPDGAFVMKVVGDEKVKTAVVLGIHGEESKVEIVSGLTEGDMVLNASSN